MALKIHFTCNEKRLNNLNYEVCAMWQIVVLLETLSIKEIEEALRQRKKGIFHTAGVIKYCNRLLVRAGAKTSIPGDP